jgi:flagellar motor switch/type III secretory pathway protein FliN
VPNARQRATFAWSRQGSVPSRSRASVSAAVGSDATTQAKARPKKTQAQLNKERHERENAGIRVVVLKACGRRGNGCKADTETELSNSALLDTSVLAVSVEVCRLPLPIGPLVELLADGLFTLFSAPVDARVLNVMLQRP